MAFNEVVGAVRRSFFAWAGPSCTDLRFEYAGTTDITTTNMVLGLNERPDNRNVIIWREQQWPPVGATAPDVDAGLVALTVLVFNATTGQIVDADIDINGALFQWSTTDQPGGLAMDVQNVVTHEVGHFIGLAHSPIPDATMFAAAPPGELIKRDLHEDDVAGLCDVYPFGRPTPLGPNQPLSQVLRGRGCDLGADTSIPTMMLLILLGLELARRRQ